MKAPWVNILAHPSFGTLVSESGSATTWSENAQAFRLTPWSNDPVGDANTEAYYIRDEDTGRFWSLTLLPSGGVTPYVTRHGFGYSVFEHNESGIVTELTVYVAIDAPVKFAALKLRNASGRARRLSVTPSAVRPCRRRDRNASVPPSFGARQRRDRRAGAHVGGR